MGRSQNQEITESNRWLRARIADLGAELEAFKRRATEDLGRAIDRAEAAEAKVKDLEELTRFERVLDLEAEVEKLKGLLSEQMDDFNTAQAEVERLREALTVAHEALRKNATTWLALSNMSALNEPYPDDPRWTPWTRFGKPAGTAAMDASKVVRAALASLEGENG